LMRSRIISIAAVWICSITIRLDLIVEGAAVLPRGTGVELAEISRGFLPTT
jgi:hypothetical protein